MNLLLELIAQFNSMNLDTIVSVGMEWFTRTKSGEFRFLDIPIFDAAGFSHLIIRFLFNLIITLLVVRYIYYPLSKRKDYLFTYVLMSITIFFLCTLLENVKLELGFALGLFAIFGIIRYRTDSIPIKEMTYLFVVIGIAVINALANKKVTHVELLLSNLGIVAATFALERLFLLKHETQKSIIYERIDLIVPDRYEELVADLKVRTGLNINRVEIGRIDFLRDVAWLMIYYYESDQTHSYEDKSSFNN
jgi:hypothetical protein